MKILITGGSGLLGKNLATELTNRGHDIYAPTSNEVNVKDKAAVKSHIGHFNPQIIVHCAAIAKFADAEKKPIDTIETNIVGTCNIAKECIARNIKLIYISTSHVFDGIEGNYKHTDKVNPLTKYAKSKVAGEMATLIHENSLVIRTEFCGVDFPFDTAYIDKFSSKEYIDVITPRIADKCISDQTGVCHVGGPRLSFYEFGLLRNPNVKPGSVKDLVSQSKVPILIDTSLISN